MLEPLFNKIALMLLNRYSPNNISVSSAKAKKKSTLVSGNTGGNKNLHMGSCKFFVLMNLIEFFK